MKVFSEKKYIKNKLERILQDYENKKIPEIVSQLSNVSCGCLKYDGWVSKCNGKSEKEIKKLGYETNPIWFEEIEED